MLKSALFWTLTGASISTIIWSVAAFLKSYPFKKWFAGMFTIAAVSFALYRLLGHPDLAEVVPIYDLQSLDNGQIAKFVSNEQKTYEWVWMNWLGVSWILTLLAAAGAIGTAVKSALKKKEDEPDKWTPVLAGLTIVATTLTTTLGAGVQADRYRRGDLKLQDAIAHFRSDQDKDKLLAAWQSAQDILEETSEGKKKESDGPEKPGVKKPNITAGRSTAKRNASKQATKKH